MKKNIEDEIEYFLKKEIRFVSNLSLRDKLINEWEKYLIQRRLDLYKNETIRQRENQRIANMATRIKKRYFNCRQLRHKFEADHRQQKTRSEKLRDTS